ncbi:hypothetical protein GCM10027194_32890 [Thalassiella azotivora]
MLLTTAELVVIVLLAQGKTDSQIAHDLQLSRHTVRHQVESAMRRTATNTRAQLLARAIHQGQITVAAWPPAIAPPTLPVPSTENGANARCMNSPRTSTLL